jgi:hypothetical protein
MFHIENDSDDVARKGGYKGLETGTMTMTNVELKKRDDGDRLVTRGG